MGIDFDKMEQEPPHPITDDEVVVEALNLALQYGVPAVLKLVKEWKKSGPISIQDIRQMELQFKNPELYFTKDS